MKVTAAQAYESKKQDVKNILKKLYLDIKPDQEKS